jgi:DNA-binding response OmpR family regulator
MIYKKPTVLIVDDDEVVCGLICDGLAEEGFICEVASNGDNALAKLKRQRFDVALLDIRLPGISGIDLLEIVENCYQMTAIIMITGLNDVNTAVEAMKLGASDYVVKPFTLDKLNASISTVLKKRRLPCATDNPILSSRDGDYIRNAETQSLEEINAIAYGVEARVDYFDFHSKIVTNRTVELARFLGLSEKEIEKWAVARNELYSKRDRRIRSTLGKIEQNSMAQMILGLTRSLYRNPYSTDEQNRGGTSDGTLDS